MMKKTIIGVIVTTLVLFVWGFLFWGQVLHSVPYESWKQSSDDVQAQQMLKQTFPETGTYYVPGIAHLPQDRFDMIASGPVAMIHINHADDIPTQVESMIQGFLLNLLLVTLMAVMFRVAGAKEFRDFARLSVAVAAVAVVMIDFGHIVWWGEAANWVIWQAVYDFSGLLIAGHLLGAFMKTELQA
jgi:hypothetical protein